MDKGATVDRAGAGVTRYRMSPEAGDRTPSGRERTDWGTPLDIAKKMGHSSLVALLKKHADARPLLRVAGSADRQADPGGQDSCLQAHDVSVRQRMRASSIVAPTPEAAAWTSFGAVTTDLDDEYTTGMPAPAPAGCGRTASGVKFSAPPPRVTVSARILAVRPHWQAMRFRRWGKPGTPSDKGAQADAVETGLRRRRGGTNNITSLPPARAPRATGACATPEGARDSSAAATRTSRATRD